VVVVVVVAAYGFFPDGYLLPTEYIKLVAEYSNQGMRARVKARVRMA